MGKIEEEEVFKDMDRIYLFFGVGVDVRWGEVINGMRFLFEEYRYYILSMLKCYFFII